jgi:hypothetical protein
MDSTAEERMLKLPFRSSIARAAVVVALFGSVPAGAQNYAPPQPAGLVGNIISGVQYDIVNQAKAEKHLQHTQAKLRRDAERGDRDAVNHDARRIANLRFRITVDEWLIRKNSLCEPGVYPYPVRIDAMSCAVIADAARSLEGPYPKSMFPRGAPLVNPPIPLAIINAAPAGANVAFAINGVEHQVAPGARQELTVSPDSTITFDGGGSLGQRRYQISQGRYEFRPSSEGLALYKLASLP